MQGHIMPAPSAATVLCHREEADNYDRVLVRLGDVWRIIGCKDALQFIVQSRAGERHGTPRWRSVRYHRTRDTLYEAATRSGIDLAPVQRAAIAALPTICGRA